ncbi:hypothetical protein QBC42DRAFT_281963 [Cladorrhinum samala]|uniref:Uncharacterized protein n=1 Tax=Cladorrhinum samala TaxID=585594 RepID=A0AAV9I5C6_9PEZI|nr:hypothetical protein QBC42DRAFT_281963 [Cladorrhinum samala]
MPPKVYFIQTWQCCWCFTNNDPRYFPTTCSGARCSVENRANPGSQHEKCDECQEKLEGPFVVG